MALTAAVRKATAREVKPHSKAEACRLVLIHVTVKISGLSHWRIKDLFH